MGTTLLDPWLNQWSTNNRLDRRRLNGLTAISSWVSRGLRGGGGVVGRWGAGEMGWWGGGEVGRGGVA